MNDIIEKYDNLGNVGTGNFGTVFKVYNKIVGRTEAVKVIPLDRNKPLDKSVLEARLLNKLRHNNVVDIFDAFVRNDKLYILMEYLEGKSVQNFINQGYRIPIGKAIRIAIDALYGLQYIHNNNYVHRDIKPSNILLDERGMAKLSDFGLTSELDEDGKYNSGFGYSRHKAPEVLKKGEYYKESDIYSIGLTLYRMINGDDFISRYDNSEIPYLIIKGEFPPRNDYSPNVPLKLHQIINKSLSINHNERFPSSHFMRSALSKISVPIEWELNVNTIKKQIWTGFNERNKYVLEVSKSILSSSHNIILKKGNSKLKKVKKCCFTGLVLKDKDKQLKKLLTGTV